MAGYAGRERARQLAEGPRPMRKALGLYLLGVPVGLIIVVMLFTKAC